MSRAVVAAPASRYPPAGRVVLVALTGAVISAPLVAVVSPLVLVVGLSALGLVVGVAVHPPLAAYVLLLTTPLIAGITRGEFIPVLRPHEAVTLLVATGLLARGLVLALAGRLRRPGIRVVDAAILFMAVTSSVLPLLWMMARDLEPTSDDVFSALQLWKYYAVYLIVHGAVRTEKHVRRCLWLSMAAAAVVAVVAILQSLNLLGVPDLLVRYFVTEGEEALLRGSRGTSTLGSSIAVGDVITFNLAIALGWLARGGTPRSILVPTATLFVFGIVSSGQFSGAIALLVALVTVGLVTGRLGRLGLALLAILPATALALRSVIARRLSGFSSLEGLPQGWVVRLDNLQRFFWPNVFSDFNFLLGVRPKAWVTVPDRGDVWIESGHTWLLWTGGLPLVAAFFVFLGVSLRTTFRTARERTDVIGVAGIASFTSLVVIAFLMALDPHITMRGSADLLFSLLALACTAGNRGTGSAP